MQRDSIGLAWLKRSILATLIILFFTSGKATAGHGDADDAASFKSPGKSRFERLFGNEESEYRFDFKSLSRQAANALYESIRLIDCNLLNSDTLTIIHQDFEMRLCEWRALESDSDAPMSIGKSETFIAHTAIPSVTSVDEFVEESAKGSVETAIDPPEFKAVKEKRPPAKASFVVEISAIESSIQVRPWGYRFTRDNLLSSYQFSSGLQVTKLYEEEYRPYDFFEVPKGSEAPVVAEVSSNSEIESPIEIDKDSTSSEQSPFSITGRLFFRSELMNSISDSIVGASSAVAATCKVALDRACGFAKSREFDIQNLLLERVQQSTPYMNQISTTLTRHFEALANQHWLTNGIKLAIGWNSHGGREIVSYSESESQNDLLVSPRELRTVFGASVLADPFAADCSLALKRPPMLVSPEMIELVATESSKSGQDSASGEKANGSHNVALGQDSATYEILVLLQNPSWIADSIDANSSKDSDLLEIGLSKVDEASEEPKSASLTPENSGIGISQR